MARDIGQIPPWAHEEALKFESLRGEPRLAAMWELAQRLESANDLEAKFAMMRMILDEAGKQGRLDHTLRAFSEMRRVYNSDVRFSHLRDLVLWYYKWIVDALPEYAEIPAETIEQVFDDMTCFYSSEGESLRPVYGLRCQAAICMGQREVAKEWFAKWQAEPPGKSDDCRACELDREITYLLYMEKTEEAMRVAEPILKLKVYCKDTPRTWTRLVGAAMKLHQKKIALVFSRMSEKRTRRVPSMMASVASHALFQTFFAKPTRARRLAFLALRRAKDSRNDVARFGVYRSCGLWAAMTAVVYRTATGLPANAVPGYAADAKGAVPLAEIAGRCLEHARVIATNLDERNGSKRYAEQLEELETAIRKVVEHIDSTRRSR